MSEDFLGRAVRLSKAGRYQEAREILVPQLKANVHDIEMWLCYVDTYQTSEDRIKVLKFCLKHNPHDQRIQMLLQELDPDLSASTTSTSVVLIPQTTRKVIPNKLIKAKKKNNRKYIEFLIYGTSTLIVICAIAVAFGVGLSMFLQNNQQSFAFTLPILQASATPSPTFTPLPTETPLPTMTPAPGGISGVASWLTKGSGAVVLPGLNIYVYSSASGSLVSRSLTDSTGKYMIDNLPSGKYMLIAYQPPPSVGTQVVEKCWVINNVTITPNRVTQVFLSMENAEEEEATCRKYLFGRSGG